MLVNFASLKNASIGIEAGFGVVVFVCAWTLPIDSINTAIMDQIRMVIPCVWFISYLIIYFTAIIVVAIGDALKSSVLNFQFVKLDLNSIDCS